MMHRFTVSVAAVVLLAANVIIPSAAAVQTKPAPAQKGIFDKKDREDLLKKVKDYLDPLEARSDAKDHDGVDSEKFKAADKKMKTGEEALRRHLKNNLSKKYKIDSDCLAATLDWTSILSEYLATHADFKKGATTGGVDTMIKLVEEPKNTYTRRIPKSYDPQKKSWPVFLVIQDKGKLSKQVIAEEFKGEGKVNILFEGDAENPGQIMVVIDIPDTAWDDQTKLHHAIMKPLREVRTILRVDPNRIAIGGIGAGVRAAATVFDRFPFLFSAFVAKGGDPGDIKPENFLNTPILLMGDASGFDREVGDGAGGKAKWLDRAKAAGVDVTVSQAPKVDEIAGWLSKVVRNPYPSHILSVVKSERVQRPCVWFAYDPEPSKEVRVDVKADRETNEITVQCENVTRYYLFLSDAVVDLSKQVTIKTNGQEPRKETMPPTFETLKQCFESYYQGMDMGAIFTSRTRPIDVPRKKASDADFKPQSSPAGDPTASKPADGK
ncbi:MAG: hypothetical protein HY286_20045 [Planctomycetes bacterium]|nr:hypothetical protein [Planctomycetota bacterium]